MRQLLVIFAGITLFLSGCKYEEGTETHTVKDDFTIAIPHYLSESDKLHPDAVFQYENRYRTVYILVLKDKKSDFESLDAYGQYATEDLTKRIEEPSVIPTENITTLNEAPAREYEIDGKLTGVAVAYYLAVVEGKEHYYRVLGWTLETKTKDGAGRKEKYFPDIKSMIHSFTLLKKP